MAEGGALVLISVLFIGLAGALGIMGGKMLYYIFVGLYEELNQC
ncbi:hypothetical protein D081_2018 [Anaerovibrio sp. JC8]|nr:hypothetical protein [Anaerovibrio sp. JC8]ORT99289.1 hypothetical protein D081_2018 [Anaerovibrio sp. JC8]